MTLKEAEAATHIPSNTIRKWVRKGGVDSYLESDGQMALRIVDLDSLLARAKELGRTVFESETTDHRPQTTESEAEAGAAVQTTTEPEVAGPQSPPPAEPEGTMLVPIDAWNKMLNQLGNLHEAGQQLAEARERAAKAETESTFLRERLAEMRQKTTDSEAEAGADVDEDPEATAPVQPPSVPLSRGTEEERSDDSGGLSEQGEREGDGRADASQGDGAEERSDGAGEAQVEPETDVETTTYWRYLTLGWRDRKRRSRK